VVVRGVRGHTHPERVVAGIDSSEAARRALAWAAAEADLHGVQLHVVHAWVYPYVASEVSGPQAHDLTRVDAALVVDEAVEWARERCGVDVVGDLAEDSPAAGVLSTVRAGDLLVLGSRGQGALKASVFGSTVNTVLDHADVTVAVVR
jgi:nucleotide-binding universal stress UspA family protein